MIVPQSKDLATWTFKVDQDTTKSSSDFIDIHEVYKFTAIKHNLTHDDTPNPARYSDRTISTEVEPAVEYTANRTVHNM